MTRSLGTTGQQVSLIGLGALEIGRDWGIGPAAMRQRPSEDTAMTFLNQVLDRGITLVDTASAYHQSEVRIGKAISSRRADYFLATKCGEHNDEPNTYYDFSYPAIRDSINTSLARLQTSSIDLMQIHFGPNPRDVIQNGETLLAMKDARDAGQIRYIGASCDTAELDILIDSGDFDVLQVSYNLFDRGSEAAIHRAYERGIGILVRFPLAMGWLTPRAQTLLAEDPAQYQRLAPYLDIVEGDFTKLPQLALHFIARLPGVSSILVGTKNITHLTDAMTALTDAIDSEWIKKAESIHQNP